MAGRAGGQQRYLSAGGGAYLASLQDQIHGSVVFD
jgi:hypothetical protein